MRVWLDSQLMASHRVTTQDVEHAVSSENAEIPGGRVEGTTVSSPSARGAS
jgi:multidrug efflux pump